MSALKNISLSFWASKSLKPNQKYMLKMSFAMF